MKNIITFIMSVTLMSIGMNAKACDFEQSKFQASYDAFIELEVKILIEHMEKCTEEKFYSCQRHNIITDFIRDAEGLYNSQRYYDKQGIYNKLQCFFATIIENSDDNNALIKNLLIKLGLDFSNKESPNGKSSINAVGSNSLLSKTGKLAAWSFFVVAVLIPGGAEAVSITPLALSTGLLIFLDRVVNVIAKPFYGICCDVRWTFNIFRNDSSSSIIKTQTCTSAINIQEVRNMGLAYVDLLCMRPYIWTALSNHGADLYYDHRDRNQFRCGYSWIKDIWQRVECSQGRGAMFQLNVIKALENINHDNLPAVLNTCIVNNKYGHSYLNAGISEYNFYECLTALTKYYAEQLNVLVPGPIPLSTTATTTEMPMLITDFMNLTNVENSTIVEFLTDSISKADPAGVEEGGDAILIMLGVATGVVVGVVGGIAIKKIIKYLHKCKGGRDSEATLENKDGCIIPIPVCDTCLEVMRCGCYLTSKRHYN